MHIRVRISQSTMVLIAYVPPGPIRSNNSGKTSAFLLLLKLLYQTDVRTRTVVVGSTRVHTRRNDNCRIAQSSSPVPRTHHSRLGKVCARKTATQVGCYGTVRV
jgi:hypothetical protein